MGKPKDTKKPSDTGVYAAEVIIDKVMAGEIMIIPAVQFGAFLAECDFKKLEFTIECKQQGFIVILTKWEFGQKETLQ